MCGFKETGNALGVWAVRSSTHSGHLFSRLVPALLAQGLLLVFRTSTQMLIGAVLRIERVVAAFALVLGLLAGIDILAYTMAGEKVSELVCLASQCHI